MIYDACKKHQLTKCSPEISFSGDRLALCGLCRYLAAYVFSLDSGKQMIRSRRRFKPSGCFLLYSCLSLYRPVVQWQ